MSLGLSFPYEPDARVIHDHLWGTTHFCGTHYLKKIGKLPCETPMAQRPGWKAPPAPVLVIPCEAANRRACSQGNMRVEAVNYITQSAVLLR